MVSKRYYGAEAPRSTGPHPEPRRAEHARQALDGNPRRASPRIAIAAADWALTEGAKEMNPRVSDNDQGEITVSLDGKELRAWSYANEDERRAKMLMAREYVEGWCDGREAA